jgi:glutaredoxin 3
MENQTKNVKVYSTPSCPWCDVAKKFLLDHKVEFEVVDVSRSPEIAMDLMNKTGSTGVPVIEIDGEYVLGFDKEAICEKLGIIEK